MPETAAKMAALPPTQAVEFFRKNMKPAGAGAPIILVKWYAYTKWVLERVAGFPKKRV